MTLCIPLQVYSKGVYYLRQSRVGGDSILRKDLINDSILFRGIMHDPMMFPSPDEFLPERFIDTTDPRMRTFDLPFGFGRRICPGMHLALNSLFMNIARILWAFDITPALDASGKEQLPDPWNYTNGFNSRPVSFNCTILPRNGKVAACIKTEWESTKERLGEWK